MADTTIQKCNKCGFETDCIEGICLECRLIVDRKWAAPLKEWNKLVDQKFKLIKALNYAKVFIDRLGKARNKEHLGRDGMDAVLEEINKIIGTDVCGICEDEKLIDDLHHNCGK